MRNLGINKIYIIAIIWFIAPVRLCLSQNYYYVNTYNLAGGHISIQMKKIDLNQKVIINTVETPLKGWIPLSTPVIIERNNRTFYIEAANDGRIAKNSDLLPGPVLNYVVINSNLQIIAQRQLDSTTLVDIYRYPEIHPTLKIFRDRGEAEQIFRGQPVLSQQNDLDFINRRYGSLVENEEPIIDGFRYYERIDPSNNRYYWNTVERSVYLLTIDFQNRRLISSREIADNRAHGNLFALSSGDSIIYAFFTNYNGVGGLPDLQKLERDSSYLITYRAETLEKLDSIPLPYPSLDSGYVAPEIGSCEKVGPYIVYYFFLSEGLEKYDPAMLFIFDTRTNEATWLRVGWR